MDIEDIKICNFMELDTILSSFGITKKILGPITSFTECMLLASMLGGIPKVNEPKLSINRAIFIKQANQLKDALDKLKINVSRFL